MSDKVYMDWQTFDNDVVEFRNYLTTHNFHEDSVIVALKRGGFPTAAALSNKMDIPVSVVSFQTRDGDDKEPTFLEPELIKNAQKIIIPDDIYDTGLTVEKLVSALEKDFGIAVENMVGVFHYNSNEMYESKLKFFRCMRNNNEQWIAFPWE